MFIRFMINALTEIFYLNIFFNIKIYFVLFKSYKVLELFHNNKPKFKHYDVQIGFINFILTTFILHEYDKNNGIWKNTLPY